MCVHATTLSVELAGGAARDFVSPWFVLLDVDEGEDVDDDEVADKDLGDFLGGGGRCWSRHRKKDTARSEINTFFFVDAKSRSHCDFVFAHHGMVEPASRTIIFLLPRVRAD